jgi:membrane dipeptidase
MLARLKYGNNVSAIDLSKEMPRQVDIPRLRKGKVGGFFWSVPFATFLGACFY